MIVVKHNNLLKGKLMVLKELQLSHHSPSPYPPQAHAAVQRG